MKWEDDGADRERALRNLPLPWWDACGAGLAALSGVFATIALGLSPYGAQLPPIIVPYTFIDLRFVGLPILMAAAFVGFARAPWPYSAMIVPSIAVSLAISAHFQGAVLLDFITDLQGSEEGTRVALGRTFATGASLVAALGSSLERGRQRLLVLAEHGGVGASALPGIDRIAKDQATRTLGFTAAAFVAFALIARIGDATLGNARAPLAEVLGALIAVGVAVLLFPGVIGRVRDRIGW